MYIVELLDYIYTSYYGKKLECILFTVYYSMF